MKTEEEMIEEIMKAYRTLTEAEKADVCAFIDAIKSRSLANAPESVKAFLRLPENAECAKSFHL